MAQVKIQQQTQFIIQGTVRNYLASFTLERRSRGLVQRTITYYTSELNLFCAWLDDQGVEMLDEISPEIIRAYLLSLNNTRNAGGIHASFRALRAFFLWFENEFEPDNWKNPIRKVKAPKVNKSILAGVEIETIKKMIKACKTDQSRRDKLILMTLFDTGMRASELLSLNISDVDVIMGSIHVKRGKGGKSRTVYLGTMSRKEMRIYLRERGAIENEALFLTQDGRRLRYGGLTRLLERRSKDAGVETPGCHDFRRSFAITMLRSGCDVLKLADMLGHSTLEVTRRYTKLVDDDLLLAHNIAGPVDKNL